MEEAEKLLNEVGAFKSDWLISSQLNAANQVSKCLSYIQSIQVDSLRDRVFGMILGSFIGDSCGSSIDAQSSMLSKDQVDHCLKLGSGGSAQIGAGQVGHHSEMQMTLMNALLASNQGISYGQEYSLDIE